MDKDYLITERALKEKKKRSHRRIMIAYALSLVILSVLVISYLEWRGC